MKKTGKIAIFVNPVSGGGTGLNLHKKLGRLMKTEDSFLRHASYLQFTPRAGAEGDAVKAIADSETVLLCGGDGTLHQMVNVMKKSGVVRRISVYPLGTGNDFSRFFVNRSKDLKQHFINISENPQTAPLDVFSINRKAFFVNYAGFGLDARILSLHQSALVKLRRLSKIPLFNRSLYIPAGIWALIFDADKVVGRDGDYAGIIAGNLRSYGGGSVFCKSSDPGDGVIELVKINGRTDFLKLGLSRFSSSLSPQSEAIVRPNGVRIVSARKKIPVQLDGEDCSGLFDGTTEFDLFHEGTLEVCI